MAEPLHIIVCLAQAFKDDFHPKLDVETGALSADDDPENYRLDPQSEYALAQALKLKKGMDGAKVQAITIGPARAERVLRQALASGADSAVRVWDPLFDKQDTGFFVARAAGMAIRAMRYDAVLCGDTSANAGSGYFGAALAAELKTQYLSRIKDLCIDAANRTAQAECRRGNKTLTYHCDLPAVFTLGKGTSCPPAPVKRILWANRADIPVFSVIDAQALAPTAGAPAACARNEKYTHPKPRNKRGLGVPQELPPHERFAHVLCGGITQKSRQWIIDGSTPNEAAGLLRWLEQEKAI